MLKIIVALTWNRTPNSPVAGGNSTTEPPMPVISTIYPAQSHIKYCVHVKNKSCYGGESNPGLPRGRLVTSPIYPAQSHIKYCIHVKNKSCIGGDSNPGLPRTWREFYH